jgi:hypothetical protein
VLLVANLDSNYHAHIFGFIYCIQFRRPQPIELIVDTGSSNTTLLGDDVTRLGINCSGLRLADVPCQTATELVFPYLLPQVDLILVTFQGWLNRKPVMTTFQFGYIHCNPPTNPQEMTAERIAQSRSLLGMDFLYQFKKWEYTERFLTLKT